MSIYQKQGQVPHKRHIVFRKPNGELYHEELFGTEGFSSTSSLVYHLNPPTMVKEIGKAHYARPEVGIDENLKALSFMGYDVEPEDDYLESRKVFFSMMICKLVWHVLQKYGRLFFKNADSDEMLFIHKGSGRCKTMYGTVDFEYGDYVIIPRGVVYKLEFDSSDNKILFVESHSPIRTPKRYRNEFGQLLEHSPFCERDFKLPYNFETHDEKGDFKIMIKKEE